MPRINAATVGEHVARQEQAVFTAAIALFVERGYSSVTLADVAREVGLARNSLYRYFPDKASILLQWYRAEVPVQAKRLAAVLDGDGSPAERITRWAHAQIDYAREPEHVLLAAMGQAATTLPPEALAELAEGHEALLAPLRTILAAAGFDDVYIAAGTDLIWGLVMAQSKRELAHGDDLVGRRLLAVAFAALTDASTVAGGPRRA